MDSLAHLVMFAVCQVLMLATVQVIPHMQIAAASGQSKIMKTLHCWRACLRPAVNGSQRPAMHTCVVHLVLAKSDKDVVLIGCGPSECLSMARCVRATTLLAPSS